MGLQFGGTLIFIYVVTSGKMTRKFFYFFGPIPVFNFNYFFSFDEVFRYMNILIIPLAVFLGNF